MERLSLRLYVLLCAAICWVKSFAQDEDDEDLDIGGRRNTEDMMSLEDYMDITDYPQIHIRFSDVMMLILVVFLCYVFGKIWKGCSYLIILIAVIFYFMR